MAEFIHHLDRAIVRAAVDERFGEGTSAIMQDVTSGRSTHDEVAMRLGVTRSAVSQRVRRARTYTRRLLIAAGILDLKQSDMVNTN